MAVPELQQQPQLSHSDLQECAVAEFLQVKTAEDCDKSREEKARRLARRPIPIDPPGYRPSNYVYNSDVGKRLKNEGRLFCCETFCC